jgi:hypothetical protein
MPTVLSLISRQGVFNNNLHENSLIVCGHLIQSNFHIVFTVPHQLSPLMLQNKRLLYNLLFRCASATLLEVAANVKWLGAEIGFLSILHTWGQTLTHHPHLHCVVPAGGFASGRDAWVQPKSAGFFAPKGVLATVFRGKFCEGLKWLFRRRQLAFHGSLAWLAEPRAFARFLRSIHRHAWIVDVRKPFGGPEHVLHYLARYTHRVAISNHRLIEMEGRQGDVPLEGLCARRQEAQDDFGRRRVHPAVSIARASQGAGAHSVLRLDGEPPPARVRGKMPRVVGGGGTPGDGGAAGQALPSLRRGRRNGRSDRAARVKALAALPAT